MTYIKNNKVLVFIIAILLLSNIAMIFFLRDGGRKGNKPQQSAREYMINKLKSEVGFSDEQISRYVELTDKHKATMKPLFEDIGHAKDSLYKLLQQPHTDSLVNHYLNMIGEKQKTIDQRIFNHFYSLKQICTAEQQPKYDSVIQRVIQGMINPQKGKKKGHNNSNK